MKLLRTNRLSKRLITLSANEIESRINTLISSCPKYSDYLESHLLSSPIRLCSHSQTQQPRDLLLKFIPTFNKEDNNVN